MNHMQWSLNPMLVEKVRSLNPMPVEVVGLLNPMLSEMMGSPNVVINEAATVQFQFQGGAHNHYNFVLGDYGNCVARVLDSCNRGPMPQYSLTPLTENCKGLTPAYYEPLCS